MGSRWFLGQAGLGWVLLNSGVLHYAWQQSVNWAFHAKILVERSLAVLTEQEVSLDCCLDVLWAIIDIQDRHTIRIDFKHN